MIDKADLIKTIQDIAPLYLSADWDNDGMQIEPAGRDIERILIALDLTPDVANEAKLGGYDFVIVHHPIFFGEGASNKKILQTDATGRLVFRLLADPPVPVGVYAAHTSFDAAEGGLCDELRNIIGLMPWADRLPADIAEEFSHIVPYARIGRFPEPTNLAGAFARVKKSLGADTNMRVSGEHSKGTLKVMVVCGGGGDAIPLAVKTGCSLLVTGDIRHHEWRQAEAQGLALIDAGHYFTERMFAPLFARRLGEALGYALANIVVDISTDIRQPYASPAR
jgi:dinuclear metal center YbgI/SA1388 family protein